MAMKKGSFGDSRRLEIIKEQLKDPRTTYVKQKDKIQGRKSLEDHPSSCRCDACHTEYLLRVSKRAGKPKCKFCGSIRIKEGICKNPSCGHKERQDG